MRLFSLINKIANVIADEITTPESFKKGEEFEEYVQKRVFPAYLFDLLEKTHNYSTNSRQYVESSLRPDFAFRDRETGREFFVEAKFRTHTYNDKFVWCNAEQLARYQAINRQIPVFLILGYGDRAYSPDALALIPLSKVKYTGLYPSYVDQFSIYTDHPMISRALWGRC